MIGKRGQLKGAELSTDDNKMDEWERGDYGVSSTLNSIPICQLRLVDPLKDRKGLGLSLCSNFEIIMDCNGSLGSNSQRHPHHPRLSPASLI